MSRYEKEDRANALRVGIAMTVFAAFALFYQEVANAQCFGGRCGGARVAWRASYGCAPCARVSTCAPCARVASTPCSACESVKACAPCEYVPTTRTIEERAEAVDACEPCRDYSAALCAACEAVKACEAVETIDEETATTCATCSSCASRALATRSTCKSCATCPNGRCGIVRTTKRAAENVAKTAVKATAKTVAATFLARANAVRARYGLSALTLDATLEAGVESHCYAMARYGRVYHASGCGYEIAAQNYGTGIDGALDQWLRSSGHAAILLNPNLKVAGVYAYRDANGRNWCAMRFR